MNKTELVEAIAETMSKTCDGNCSSCPFNFRYSNLNKKACVDIQDIFYNAKMNSSDDSPGWGHIRPVEQRIVTVVKKEKEK